MMRWFRELWAQLRARRAYRKGVRDARRIQAQKDEYYGRIL